MNEKTIILKSSRLEDPHPENGMWTIGGRNSMKQTIAMILLLGSMTSEIAMAQAPRPDDVVVIRRVIGPMKKVILNPPADNSEAGYYSWRTTPWNQTGACGDVGPQTRTAWCERTGGQKVADSFCFGNGSGPRPVESMNAVNTQTCEYQWAPGEWQGAIPSCGAVSQTREVSCVSKNGVVGDSANCKGTIPDRSQTVTNYNGCEFMWAAGSWKPLMKFCGDVDQTRDVYCRASNGSQVPSEYCANSGEPPETTFTYHFPTCNPDGTIDSNARGWVTGEWTKAPENACAKFVVSRQVQCVTGEGVVVNDAECSTSKPKTTDEQEVTTNCSYSWQSGPTMPAPRGCGTVFATRSVNCVRTDGLAVNGEACGLGSKPESQFATTDYSQCKFEWKIGEWSEWSQQCGEATRTRAVMCQRSDGGTVEDAQCSGTRPSSTETSYMTTGCGIEWSASPWRSESTCAKMTNKTRDVACRRSDGQILEDSQCSGTRPLEQMKEDDFSTCGYTWSVGEYGEPAANCGKTTISRTVACQRSDGEKVPEEQCGAAGEKPGDKQEVEVTTGFGYAWEPGEWSAPLAACGASVRNRVNKCVRSDGTAVAASFCTEAEPARSESAQDYSTCTYKWSVSQWNNDGSCGDSAVQTRKVTCQRSEGTDVAETFCASAGTKPAATQTVTDYTGCTYEWKSVPGTWSSTCSTSATRTNIVTCGRSDNTTVGDEYCSEAKPPVSETKENLTQCTYVGTYDNWTTCRSDTPGSTAGKQTGTLTSCRRSDNTTVANSFCEATQVRDCSVNVDRYARVANIVQDAALSPSTYAQTTQVNSAVLKLAVRSTICWDKQTNTEVGAATCANLPTGANIYDIVEIPTTIIPSLREVYVNQADLQAVIPYGGTVTGYPISSICGGANVSIVRIQEASGTSGYGINCGAPDNPSKYIRAANYLGDPESYAATKDKNTSYSASTLSFAVADTTCWDSSKNAAANKSKCQYLPTGASLYDIIGVPATFVSEFREIYVNKADIQATTPYGGGVIGNTPDVFCNAGWTVKIGPAGGTKQSWTVRCGAPEAPSSYARAADNLQDPYNYSALPASSRTGNVETKSALNFMVANTVCRDLTKNATASSASKCQYLTTGANLYDLIAVPATFVKELREVYINIDDVSAAIPYGGTALGQAITNFCSTGRNINILTSAGQAQTWTVRCGTPDNAANYRREIYTLGDPSRFTSSQINYNTYNKEGASSLRLTVTSTTCIDTRNGATATPAKCQYLATGPNVYDYLDVPGVQVPKLREIYVQPEDIIQRAPYAYTIGAYNSSSSQIGNSAFCTQGLGYLTYVGNTSTNYVSTLRCGPVDSELNYEKRGRMVGDPYFQTALTTAQKNVNVSSSPKFTFSVAATSCIDKRTGAVAANSKCDYISTLDNINDMFEVEATYVDGLREVYFDKNQLLSKYPNLTALNYANGSSASLSNLCNGNALYVQGPAGRVAYKGYCDRPVDSAEAYTYQAIRFGDPYSYYYPTRVTNQSTSGNLIYAVAIARCYDQRTGAVATDQNKCDYIAKPVTVNTHFTIGATWDTTAKTVTVSRAAIKAQQNAVVPDAAYNDICGANWNSNIGTVKVVCQP